MDLSAPILRSARRLFILSAVFSGLCVLSTLWVVVSVDGRSRVLLLVPMTVLTLCCGLTIAFSIMASVRMADLLDLVGSRTLLGVLDVVAAAGLVIVCGALWVQLLQNAAFSGEIWLIPIGIGFLLMGLTTPRHYMFYASLGRAFGREGFHTTAAWLLVLGWLKAIYEFAWLTVCIATPLLLIGVRSKDEVAVTLLFGALFGLAGFCVVWVFMIVMHSVAATRRRAHRDHIGGAFEVLPVSRAH